jgi:phage terminase large subunit-like protein
MSSRPSDFAVALLRELEGGWTATARPDQLPPAGDWTFWLSLGGRGAGKTRSLSEWVIQQQVEGRKHIALVAPTAADARNVLTEGPSGILPCAPAYNRPVFNPSLRRLTWSNGAIATLYSADEPERLRGPQYDAAAVDELCAFRRPEASDMLMFGLRLGDRPRCAIATTPRPTRILKALLAREGLDVRVSRATSYDNRAHLAPAFFTQITRKYEGTRLGRQELMAELLTDVPGALWTAARIEELRRDAAPVLRRVVVAIDPSGSGGEDADECGIVACGLDEADHGWVLADRTLRGSPGEWAAAAISLYRMLGADRVVAETNYGGEMVEAVLRQVDPNVAFKAVHASRGKVQRAEPIAALYEQGRIHHLGTYPELEDELCAFTPAGYAGGSPNRADALVWAFTELVAQPMRSWGIFELTRRMALGLPIGRAPPPEIPARPSRDEAILDERQRFAAIAAARLPTADEIAAHTNAIDTILRGP